MNKDFWQNLPKPFFCLAPMADVTDCVFRPLIAKYSKKNKNVVFWTEFVSADGLMSAGREVLKKDLEYSEIERPIVAQLFSSNVDNMRQASRLCAELGFDGIDINMGCPDRSIEKQGCGAGMIKTPDVAKEIIQAVKDGIKDAGSIIPVSVKTRIGYNKIEVDTWIPFLLSQNISALTVHMRTRKEMSKVPAHWDLMKDILKYRDEISPNTKIIGNGDVMNLAHARELSEKYDMDGVMLGRAIFGNPWLFDENLNNKNRNTIFIKIRSMLKRFFGIKDKFWLDQKSDISIKQKLYVMIEHTKNFEDKLGNVKNFAIMKKHFKAYVNGFSGAKELRVSLIDNAKNADDVKNIVEKFLKN